MCIPVWQCNNVTPNICKCEGQLPRSYLFCNRNDYITFLAFNLDRRKSKEGTLRAISEIQNARLLFGRNKRKIK